MHHLSPSMSPAAAFYTVFCQKRKKLPGFPHFPAPEAGPGAKAGAEAAKNIEKTHKKVCIKLCIATKIKKFEKSGDKRGPFGVL